MNTKKNLNDLLKVLIKCRKINIVVHKSLEKL